MLSPLLTVMTTRGVQNSKPSGDLRRHRNEHDEAGTSCCQWVPPGNSAIEHALPSR